MLLKFEELLSVPLVPLLQVLVLVRQFLVDLREANVQFVACHDKVFNFLSVCLN